MTRITPFLLVLLPLLGVAIAGHSLSQYLELPPLTRYVRHAPFSLGVFIVIALFCVATIGPLIAIGWRRRGRAEACGTRHAMPVWGWFGLVAMLISWFIAWTRFPVFAEIQRHSFLLLWLSYILLVNGLCVWRSGQSPMTRDRRAYLMLFPASAGFWWFFEYLNRFVQNWYYEGAEVFSRSEYLVYASLSFATVLPAVISTAALLATIPALNRPFTDLPKLRSSQPRRLGICVLVAASVGLALIGVWPSLLFPLPWVSPLIIGCALAAICGRPSVLSPLAKGDWRRLVIPPLAALICGFFWEMWNLHSVAKWVYSIPYVHVGKIFEMPVLGYAGYLPFGLECIFAAQLAGWRHGLASGPAPVAESAIPPLVRVALAGVVLATIPAMWCKGPAPEFFADGLDTQSALVAGMLESSSSVSTGSFSTGSELFDGEWFFGTHMMAAMGHGQVARAQPSLRGTCKKAMEADLHAMLTAECRAFDRQSWGADALETLDRTRSQHHAAYLGYMNLALGLYAYVFEDLDPVLADWHARITEALIRRLEDSAPRLLIETYPGEIYPVDNCTVLSSISLNARAKGESPPEIVDRCLVYWRQAYVDPENGLLIQAISGAGDAFDSPRGSGSAFGAYFLAYADLDFSAALYEATRKQLLGNVLGFGAMREYPEGYHGNGDIDSGPLVFGYSISATGFSLGAARIHGDAESFADLYATAHLFGGPAASGNRLNWATGGALGDAIMFAMVTAPRSLP
jgi:hypothetical protein